jgi:predicted ATPase/DNA-binding SARP family transcriptional activator
MRLLTLGRLALEGSAFGRHKPLLLLAYLALEGSQSRRSLADLFFADARDPRDGLSTTIRRMTVAAPGCLEVVGDRIRATIRCDAGDLLAALEAEAHSSAIALYRGPFVQGIDLTLGVEVEEWVVETRERLAGRVQDAYLRLADAAARQGATSTASRHVMAALGMTEAPALEPEEERRLRGLVEARRSAHTPALQQRLEHRDRALPTYATSFVGRERELRLIGALLADPSCRLLTLHGPGGIGKSRLAVRLAEASIGGASFRDGVAFVELSALTSEEQVVPALAASVGCQLQGGGSSLRRLTRCLARRHLLLILDNFEHLLSASALPAALLQACPDLSILVTSRQPLHLREEHVFTLGGLGFSSQVPGAGMGDAMRLFQQRAAQARRDSIPGTADSVHVRRICELVDGSPLGIELSASWTRTLPLEAIAAEIASDLDVLRSSAMNTPQRHLSIRAVFDHSWDLLDQVERLALARLSSFRGGFSREAAAAVADTPLPLLASLVDKSLVRVDHGGRYEFHPLVQHYARERLREQPSEARVVRDRHARYYCDVLAELQRSFSSAAGGNPLSELERELDNVRHAWEWAAQRQWAHEVRLASPLLRHVFDKRGQCQDGALLFDQALASLGTSSASLLGCRGRVLIDQAHFYHYLGAHRDAIDRAEAGLELLERFGEDVEVRDGLHILGGSMWRDGNYAGAKRALERSLMISSDLHDQRGMSNSMSYLAIAELALGNVVGAERLCRRSLELCQQSRGGAPTVIALKNYGSLLRVMGATVRARSMLEEALTLAQQLGYPRITADVLANLALLAIARGEPLEARASAEQAVAVAHESGIPTFEAFALVALGRALTSMGDDRGAQTPLATALSIALELHSRPLELMVLTALAESAAGGGDLSLAHHLLEFVCKQPMLDSENRSMAERIRSEIADRHPVQPLAGASTTDVDVFAGQILRRLAGRT